MSSQDKAKFTDLSRREQIDALLPFAGHHPIIQLIGVLSMFAVWIGAYWIIMQATGWNLNAGEPTAAGAAARRHAAAISTLVSGFYVGLLWNKGIGNPLFNFLIVLFIPYIISFLFPEIIKLGANTDLSGKIFSVAETDLYSRFGGKSAWDFATPIFGSISIAVPIAIHSSKSDEEMKEWRRTHWRKSWYEREYGEE